MDRVTAESVDNLTKLKEVEQCIEQIAVTSGK